MASLSLTIQQAGSAYFNDLTERNLYKLYVLVEPVIIKTSMAVLRDDDLAKENLSKVMLKIVSLGQKGFVFDESKSFVSFLFNTTRNSAIAIYNKRKVRKEYTESDLRVHDGDDEDSNGYIEEAAYELDKYNTEFDEIEFEEDKSFHDDLSLQYKRVYDMVGQYIPNEEDRDLMYDVMFGGLNPKEIAGLYGINSRITISSRRTRLQYKIRDSMLLEINGSKFLDRELDTGKFAIRYPSGENKYVGMCQNFRLHGELTEYYQNGKKFRTTEYENGVRHGKFAEFYENGNKKVDGEYRKGNKSGTWRRYYENGTMSERYCQISTYYELFDENGKMEDNGFRASDVTPYITTYPDGRVRTEGHKKNGKRVGIWKRFFGNGKLEEKADYVDKTYKCWDENGKLEEEGVLTDV